MVLDNTSTCLEIAAEPANLGMAAATKNMLKTLMVYYYRSGIPSLFPLDITMFTIKYGFGFKRFSPLFETFNEMIGRFLAHGLLSKSHELTRQPKESDNLGAQVLTMDHLELGFVACLIPLGIAIIVFFIEFMVSKFQSNGK